MNYNNTMLGLLAASVLLAAPARAADPKAETAPAGAAATADKMTLELADYFLKVPTSEANPKLVDAFLAIDAQTLPKGLRVRTQAKQLEIQTLLHVHDVEKAGVFVQPADGNATAASFVRPLRDMNVYALAGYVEMDEDSEEYIMGKTKCTEIDLGTKFTLMIFHDRGKPRKLMLHTKDPLQPLIAEHKGKGGGTTHFFGLGYTCQH